MGWIKVSGKWPEVAALRSFLNEWIVGRGEGLGASRMVIGRRGAFR